MVIYSNHNANRSLVEQFVALQKSIRDTQSNLPFFHVELKGCLQICCRGIWSKFECYEDPYLLIEKSVHGALFLIVVYNEISYSTGELLEEGLEAYFPFDLIEQIVIE